MAKKQKKSVKKGKQTSNRFDKYFMLGWKKVLWVVIAWVVAFILHGVVYGLFKSYFDVHGGDEPFFFIIAVIVIPLYVIIAVIYSLIRLIMGKSK